MVSEPAPPGCMRENEFLRGRSEEGKGLVIASLDKQDEKWLVSEKVVVVVCFECVLVFMDGSCFSPRRDGTCMHGFTRRHMYCCKRCHGTRFEFHGGGILRYWV